jgi:hypothetical protein
MAATAQRAFDVARDGLKNVFSRSAVALHLKAWQEIAIGTAEEVGADLQAVEAVQTAAKEAEAAEEIAKEAEAALRAYLDTVL